MQQTHSDTGELWERWKVAQDETNEAHGTAQHGDAKGTRTRRRHVNPRLASSHDVLTPSLGKVPGGIDIQG